MKDDLIKRSDAIKALCDAVDNKGDYEGEWLYTDEFCKAIDSVPSADRPQGKWLIEKTMYDNYNYRCSYCDWYETHAYPDVEPYNFCPNCGARMKGADDESDS